MTDEVRTLVRLSAGLAARDPGALGVAMEECVRMGIGSEAEEVLLQSYLFLGYPIALGAFALWRDISGQAGGEADSDDWVGWAARGEAVCQTVYGGQYDGLRRNVRNLHPDMERWMVVEGYGKVLGRPGLDLATRELAIAALLAVLDAPRQLYSHLRGALNSGAERPEVEAALREACTFLDEDGRRGTWQVWDRLRERSQSSEPPMAGES